jgi:hypothetical protein
MDESLKYKSKTNASRKKVDRPVPRTMLTGSGKAAQHEFRRTRNSLITIALGQVDPPAVAPVTASFHHHDAAFGNFVEFIGWKPMTLSLL